MRWQLALVAGLATLGLVAAVVLMTTFPYSDAYSDDVAAMQDTSQWVAWVVVLAIQTAVWLVLLPSLVVTLRTTKPERRPESTGASTKRPSWWNWQTTQSIIVFFLLVLPVLASVLLFDASHRAQEAFACHSAC